MLRLNETTARAEITRLTLPAGAGRDAMEMAAITDLAPLLTGGGSGGISHDPLGTMNAEDTDITVPILLDFARRFDPAK